MPLPGGLYGVGGGVHEVWMKCVMVGIRKSASGAAHVPHQPTKPTTQRAQRILLYFLLSFCRQKTNALSLTIFIHMRAHLAAARVKHRPTCAQTPPHPPPPQAHNTVIFFAGGWPQRLLLVHDDDDKTPHTILTRKSPRCCLFGRHQSCPGAPGPCPPPHRPPH